MTIIIIALFIICITNSAILINLFFRQKRMRKEFAIIEQLLRPFLKWIDDTTKKRDEWNRISKEKEIALLRQKEKKE